MSAWLVLKRQDHPCVQEQPTRGRRRGRGGLPSKQPPRRPRHRPPCTSTHKKLKAGASAQRGKSPLRLTLHSSRAALGRTPLRPLASLAIPAPDPAPALAAPSAPSPSRAPSAAPAPSSAGPVSTRTSASASASAGALSAGEPPGLAPLSRLWLCAAYPVISSQKDTRPRAAPAQSGRNARAEVSAAVTTREAESENRETLSPHAPSAGRGCGARRCGGDLIVNSNSTFCSPLRSTGR